MQLFSTLLRIGILILIHYLPNLNFSIIKPHARIWFIIICCLNTQSCSTSTMLRTSPNTVEMIMMKRSESILDNEAIPDRSEKSLKHCIILTQTAFGFIMENAERELDEDYKQGLTLYAEANKYFTRAVVLGENYMSLRYPWFDEWLNNSTDKHIKFGNDDVDGLYWLAAAYGGAVSSSRGDPEWVIQLPKIGKLLDNALAIDPNWNYGSLYSAMIPYSLSRPDAPVNASEVAEGYYRKALVASDGKDLGLHVSFAENVLIARQNRSEFVRLLTLVLESNHRGIKELEVGNYMAKKRAQWLLGRTEELFY